MLTKTRVYISFAQVRGKYNIFFFFKRPIVSRAIARKRERERKKRCLLGFRVNYAFRNPPLSYLVERKETIVRGCVSSVTCSTRYRPRAMCTRREVTRRRADRSSPAMIKRFETVHLTISVIRLFKFIYFQKFFSNISKRHRALIKRRPGAPDNLRPALIAL